MAMSDKMERARFSRLLIVEDDPAQLRTLTNIMRCEGFDVVGCDTGSKALELVEREDFGTAVVDFRLPDISGTQLLERMRGLDRNLQVIINTAYGSFDSAKDAVNLGAFAYTEKGSCPEELVRQVHAASRWYLDRYAQELEEAVAARTRELRETNEALRVEVAEREKVEVALGAAKQAAERASQAKGQFLANMSHEIRTPLNGVMGMTDLLLDSDLDAEQRSFAQAVRSCGLGLLRLLSDILDLSKIEAGMLTIEPIPFDLARVVSEVHGLLALQAADKGLGFRVDYAPDVPRCFVGDPDRIRQVILNLAGNALKFTKQGEVSISVQCEQRGDEDARMRIAVEDTGVGVAPDALERIFDNFVQADPSTTRHYGGTGLGLAISKRLIELMGGGIGARSRIGEGSTFWLWLPLPLCQPRALAESFCEGSTSEVLPERFDALVLVVEDNAVNQLVAVRMLEKLGCRTNVAADGSEAVIAVSETRYDLVLMDCQMPKMNGFLATAAIRRQEAESGSRLPIVAMTADAMRGARERCLEAGMDDYLAKPVERSALRQMLARFLPGEG